MKYRTRNRIYRLWVIVCISSFIKIRTKLNIKLYIVVHWSDLSTSSFGRGRLCSILVGSSTLFSGFLAFSSRVWPLCASSLFSFYPCVSRTFLSRWNTSSTFSKDVRPRCLKPPTTDHLVLILILAMDLCPFPFMWDSRLLFFESLGQNGNSSIVILRGKVSSSSGYSINVDHLTGVTDLFRITVLLHDDGRAVSQKVAICNN